MYSLQHLFRLFWRYRLDLVELFKASFGGSDASVLLEVLKDEGLVDGIVLPGPCS